MTRLGEGRDQEKVALCNCVYKTDMKFKVRSLHLHGLVCCCAVENKCYSYLHIDDPIDCMVDLSNEQLP